jgi:hypothetical protein
MTRFNYIQAQPVSRQVTGGAIRDCSGINTFAHETEIKDNQLTIGKNLDLSTIGKVKKRLGKNRVLNDPGGTAVVGLLYFKAPTVDERMIMVQGTSIYQSTLPLETSGNWTDLSLTITADQYSTSMVNADEKVFISNGTDTVKYHNGAGVLECGDENTDPPKGKVLVYHKNRLWVFNTATNPDWGWYSNALDPLVFNRSTNVFKVASGEAVEIMAAVATGDSIIIFKEDSIHELTIAGGTAAYWNLRPIENRYGCAAYYCAVSHGGIIYYLSYSGVRTLGGEYAEIPVTKLIKTTWDSVYWNYITRSRMMIWDNKLYVSVPTGTSTFPNTVLVWDFLTQSWSVIDGWSVGCWGIFVEKTPGSDNAFEETLMIGDGDDGWVNHCFKATQFNDDSTAIDMHIETKAYDFGAPSTYKEGGTFVLNYEQVPSDTEIGSSVVFMDDNNYVFMDDNNFVFMDNATSAGSITISASIDGADFVELSRHSGYEYPLDSLGRYKKIKFKIQHNSTCTERLILTGWEIETFPTRTR